MKPVRFGIIGCGAIHATHCKALQELAGTELAGVYDVLPERSNAAAERFQTKAFASMDEMWREVDAVTLCVPSGLHGKVGCVAAEAGKHVLSEKPIDVKTERAHAMIDACARAGVTLGVISQHRFAPDVKRLRELVLNDELGRILHCDAYVKWFRTQGYYDSAEWRGKNDLDGGCMLNQGIHTIDLMQWLMGGVDNVRCDAATILHDIEAEDTAVALIEYNNGARGTVQISTTCYPGFAERIEVHGRKGSAILEADRLTFVDIDSNASNAGFYGKGVTSQPVPPAVTAAGEAVENLWDVLHREQVADFANAVRERRKPALDGVEALQPLKVVRACYESAAQGGRRVPLEASVLA